MPIQLPPTLSGDQLSISRLLQSPAYLQRRLRSFQDLRFVADQLLTGRYRSQGGAVIFETSENPLLSRPAESIAPGGSYPKGDSDGGTAGLAAVAKWGQSVRITDEEINRNVYPGTLVDRRLRKVVNTVISQVDGISMSAVSSIVTQTFDVVANGGGAWTGATPTMLRDILRAKALIVGQNQGYKPDFLGLNDTEYAYLMSDTAVQNARQREAASNPAYTGNMDVIAGLRIVVAPAFTAPIIADSTQLGGMADEMDAAPGYSVSDLAVQVKAIRVEETDSWLLQGRRKTVPFVQEATAAVKLTNTGV